ANLKTALDAFNEGYHVPGVHPQVLLYLDNNYVYESHGRHSVFYPAPGIMGSTSPRLGEFESDPASILRALVDDGAGVDLFTEEDRALVNQFLEMAPAMPTDVPL